MNKSFIKSKLSVTEFLELCDDSSNSINRYVFWNVETSKMCCGIQLNVDDFVYELSSDGIIYVLEEEE